jgi:tetratricopeptide (TPR) repeat protein
MIRKIKIYVTLLAVALTATACLDKYPEDAILDNEAMRTFADARQVVAGIHSGFKSNALYSGLMAILPDIQADLVYAVDGYSNTYGDFYRWEIMGNALEIEAVYASLYSIIERCNFFFAYVDDVRATLTDDTELDLLQELEGDVYFARALAYSELIKLYCKAYDPATADSELGVVLVSDYYNPGVAVRASLKESYDFVLADMTMAAEYIVRDPADYVTYFTQATVNALYARIYLYMQDWNKAIEYSTKVIDNDDNIALSVPNDYTLMWQDDMGQEVIWRIPFELTSYGGRIGERFIGYNFVTFMPDYVVRSEVYNSYIASDLRKSVFFQRITTGYPHGLTAPLLMKYFGNETFVANNILHVSQPKPFRVSEQYLIRAEAYCEKGDYSKASADLGALRSIRSAGTASLNADNWLNEISAERVRELFMEGFRLQDLKRWGRGFERTAQNNSVPEGGTLKVEANDPLFVWPIPQHELDSPGAQIEPNESNQ